MTSSSVVSIKTILSKSDNWSAINLFAPRGWELPFPPFGNQPVGGNSLSHPSAINPWAGTPFPTLRQSTRGRELPFPPFGNQPVGGNSLSHPSAINITRGWELPFPPFGNQPVGGNSLSHPSAINPWVGTPFPTLRQST